MVQEAITPQMLRYTTLRISAVESLVKEVGAGQEVAVFRFTAANFRQQN